MKNLKYFLLTASSLLFFACSSGPSLQKYYVDNSENPNFMSFDVPASIINMEKVDLTKEEKEAYASLKKLNVLAFKKTPDNEADYLNEKAKVSTILKNEKYNDLMQMNTPYGKGSIKYLGEEDAIDELIIYGDSQEKGFMIVRVLGDHMKPEKLMPLIQAISKSDIDKEQFKGLSDLFKK